MNSSVVPACTVCAAALATTYVARVAGRWSAVTCAHTPTGQGLSLTRRSNAGSYQEAINCGWAHPLGRPRAASRTTRPHLELLHVPGEGLPGAWCAVAGAVLLAC